MSECSYHGATSRSPVINLVIVLINKHMGTLTQSQQRTFKKQNNDNLQLIYNNAIHICVSTITIVT